MRLAFKLALIWAVLYVVFVFIAWDFLWIAPPDDADPITLMHGFFLRLFFVAFGAIASLAAFTPWSDL